ncbi:MAG: hypothetical protein K0R76_20 [Alphaproteobacteria bacterium]|nr:hypothetical protein [Alphaproteobacteria bacterium]
MIFLAKETVGFLGFKAKPIRSARGFVRKFLYVCDDGMIDFSWSIVQGRPPALSRSHFLLSFTTKCSELWRSYPLWRIMAM